RIVILHCDKASPFAGARRPEFRPDTLRSCEVMEILDSKAPPSKVLEQKEVSPHAIDRLRDFTADRRLILLAAMAIVVGTAGAFAAWALLDLIYLVINIAYHGKFSVAPVSMGAALGPISVLVPVVGCLIVGLMARFGSEKIRGHGIPEAMEAIIIGRSQIQPKVALLKPLSSAISIGTGGPFGAEGPIIM